MADRPSLLDVLESLRERGALGEPSLPRAIEHAEAFVAALPPEALRIIDLGSGGGLPGLVIADRLPTVRVVLTDRRARRMDLLRFACARLEFDERVSVITADVVDLGCHEDFAGSFDAVTARSFGDPMWTATCGRPFLAAGGVIVISEPPVFVDRSSRWDFDKLLALDLRPTAEQFPFVQRLEHVTV